MNEPAAQETRTEGATFALLGPELVADPYPAYEKLRAAGDITWLPGIYGVGAWGVVSHSACAAVLRSRQFGKEGHRVLSPGAAARVPRSVIGPLALRKDNMLSRDPPDHTRLRGLVSLAFTPRTVEQLREHVAGIAERLLDAVQPLGQMDLVRDFAFPLPVIVIAELLGVPAQDRDQFKAWSTELIKGLNPAATPSEHREASQAIDALSGYLRAVIEERRRELRADLISDLIRAQESGDQLSTEEIIATARLLLAAGHETTMNVIGNGMLALLRHPHERAALAADPELLPGALEELVRYDGPVQLTVRFALEDTILCEQKLKRGDIVVVLLAAANRDPARFLEPARLDLRRENAREHIAFGAGIHYCLGASLARLEGQIAIGALLRRLPRLALGAGPLEWRNHLVLRGLKALPVTF